MSRLRALLAPTQKDRELQENLDRARRSIQAALRADPSQKKIARNLNGILRMIEDTSRMRYPSEEPEPRTEKKDVRNR